MTKTCGPSHTFAFPLVVIDFEATALTLQSYPIEVGVAIARNNTEPMETWSSLIQPDPSWNMRNQWDPDAEGIHGISGWQLRQGLPAVQVMEQLNALIAPIGHAWCDGGHYDELWSTTSTLAAGIRPSFRLVSIGARIELNAQAKNCFDKILRSSSAPHRAGPDAERLCRTLAPRCAKMKGI